MSRLRLVLLLPLLLLLAGARVVELVDQEPVAIPAGTSAETTVKAIRTALLGRKWTIAKESPGRIDTTLYIRSHVANVAIEYDQAQVRFSYVGSENLKFKVKEGKRYIHRNYHAWVRDLAGDISRNLYMATP